MLTTIKSLTSTPARRLGEPLASPIHQPVSEDILKWLEEMLKNEPLAVLESKIGMPVGAIIVKALAEFDESKHPRDLKEYKPRNAEFDPNQARDEHGRWTDGGTSHSAAPQGTGKVDLVKERVLRKLANELEFPNEKFKIEAYDKTFKVGDKDFNSGGFFRPSTGEITLNANSLERISTADATALLAHEVMHRDFNDVANVLELEGGGMPSSNPLRDDVPGVQTILDAFGEDGELYMRDDGITSYSRAYWNKAKKLAASDETDDFNNAFTAAMNETLAEISKTDMHARQMRFVGSKPTSRWRQLHTAFKNVAKILRDANQ